MTQPLTDEQLAAIQAREEAATPGPWWADSHEIYAGPDGIPAASDWVGETCVVGELEQSEANAAFIAAARTDVPALLADNEMLRALVRDLARTDPCGLDHHGYCQEHWWFDSSPCPHGVAQRAGLVHDDTDEES